MTKVLNKNKVWSLLAWTLLALFHGHPPPLAMTLREHRRTPSGEYRVNSVAFAPATKVRSLSVLRAKCTHFLTFLHGHKVLVLLTGPGNFGKLKHNAILLLSI